MNVLSQIKSVNEFLADLHDAVKETPWPQAIAAALPWTGYIGEALADAVGPIKFITTLWQKYSAVTDVREQGILIGRIAFQRSVQQAFQAVVVHIAPLGKISSQFVDRNKSPEQDLTFDTFTLDSAATHPFFVRSRNVLEKFLQSIDMDESIRVRVVSEVSRRFANHFASILGHRDNKERFHEFREMLKTGPGIQTLLDQHATYQRWLFEEQRVLNFEPFSLQHTYIETHCGELSWKQYQELVKEQGDPFAEDSAPRQPVLQRIKELVQDPKFKECIVIQGHAGAGKSSLTKRLCCELLDQGFRPIRIELKDLDVTSTEVHLSELLPMAVKLGDEAYDSELIDRFLPRNSPLEETIKGDLRTVDSQKISNYVLILDAWDEVSIGASEGYQQAIDKLLHRLRDQYLGGRLGCHVRVILSGRPSDAVMQSGFLKDDSVILTMRPFDPDQLKSFVEGLKLALELRPVRLPANWEEEGVWVRWSLDDASKAVPVEKRFREAFEKRAKKEAARDEALEILGLPLLCHLALRLIAEWDGDVQGVLDNTTVLYRSLVDMLGMGSKPQDQNLVGKASHLGGEELRNLLRSTAEAMSVRGVESISRSELEERIGEECDDLEQRVERLSRDQILSRLMISFFFKGGHKDLGCEFSHKSFREYLFAEQIVEELRKFGEGTEPFSEKPAKDYWRDFDERDPRFSLSRRMTELLGPNWLTKEVGKHLTQLIGWEIARSAGCKPYPIPERLQGVQSKPLEMVQWERVRDGLADLWDWWGEGVHMRPQPSVHRRSKETEWNCVAWDVALTCRELSSKEVKSIVPVRLTTIDGHLGDGLFQLCADVHRELIISSSNTDDPSVFPQIKWPTERENPQRRYQTIVTVSSGQQAIAFHPTGDEDTYFWTYVSRIEAAGFRWGRRSCFPLSINLSCIDFSDTSLVHLQLHDSDMRSVNLQRSKMMYCVAPHVDLRFANLNHVLIQSSEFYEAKLQNADLRGSEMMRVEFIRAHLESARFENSALSDVKFRESRLKGASFQGAKGTQLDFRFITLDEADFTNTEFSMTKISGSRSKLLLNPGLEKWKETYIDPDN